MDVLCQTSHKHIPKVKMLTYVLGPSSGISKALPSSNVSTNDFRSSPIVKAQNSWCANDISKKRRLKLWNRLKQT